MHFVHIHLKDDKRCHWYSVDPQSGVTATKCALFAEAVKFEDIIPTMELLLRTFTNIDELSSVPCNNAALTNAQKKLLRIA